MDQCPDLLTIQSAVDREETNSEVLKHIRKCAACSKNYREIEAAASLADRLTSTATLPSSFYTALTAKTTSLPFPGVPAAAAIFFLILISAYLVDSTFIQWWFSVGITRQLGHLIDLFLNLFYLSHAAGPNLVVIVFTALVLLEVIILNFLRKMEEHGNV